MTRRDPYQPESGKAWQDAQAAAAAEQDGPTDLASLMTSSAVTEIEATAPKALPATDFTTLKGEFRPAAYTPLRTWNDVLIDALTPALIFIMVYAVVFFLLDVRYVFTAVHDTNLRGVAFCFILGVVALNRLMARDGSDESVLYMGGLAGAIGLYTFATTGMYDVGSVAKTFLNDNPYLATAFNMAIVAFLWWLVNRLTHECCVDENRTAGDVGIFTATARRWEHRFRPDPKPRRARQPAAPAAKRGKADPFPMMEIEAFDPVEGYKARVIEEDAGPVLSTADRIGPRHPGMAIFYFSVPVMAVFALGLRYIQHGGPGWVRAGAVYMGIYTTCALCLLMLTSLAGLRQYFRSRRLAMPGGVAWFWIGLGLIQIAMVLAAAARLPMPSLPDIAYVADHERDAWDRGRSTFELSPIAQTQLDIVEETQLLERVGDFVLVIFALLAIYGALKGLASLAARIARQRHRYPQWVVRFFDRLDRFIVRFTRLPKRKPRRKRVRVQRAIATSAEFRNTMSDESAAPKNTNTHVEEAYAALCALAHDLGVPREDGQTPYEFLDAFPPALQSLRKEAEELTRLYVLAAYSPLQMDDAVRDRLRRFWLSYERVRRRVLK